MVNTFLMDQVLDYIEAHPEEHDPKFWAIRTACGTTMCFAGHAVVLSGAKMVWEIVMVGGQKFPRTYECLTAEGKSRVTSDYAQELLGLSNSQATALFKYNNDLDDIKRICKEIANGEIS